MKSELRRRQPKSLSCLSLFLLLFIVNLAALAQTSPSPLEPGAPGSDALPFLTELLERYTHGSSYHFEYTEEHQSLSEFSRYWGKALVTSIVGPANHYRFELRGEFGTAVQVSDGQTEWVYYGPLNQYVQQPASREGPSEVMSRATIGLGRLRQTESHMKNFAYVRGMVRTATFAADQTIELAGRSVSCIVITTEGEMPDARDPTTIRFTFWVDKQTKVIRKSAQRSESELTAVPGAHYTGLDERLYQVAEVDVANFPEGTFGFAPPPSAVLVKKFEDKQSQGLAKLLGKPAPVVTLKGSESEKGTPLQSFLGKPVLLDFWATWCMPCRESLPALAKLYQENRAKGLVLISLDEDDDNPQRAAELWAKSKMAWPNFHANKEILEKFPEHGIPYFILLDPSGKVVLSYAGWDEDVLRKSVAAFPSSPTFQSPTTH
jgi:thiol-disulfide isomerase/thioredoxin